MFEKIKKTIARVPPKAPAAHRVASSRGVVTGTDRLRGRDEVATTREQSASACGRLSNTFAVSSRSVAFDAIAEASSWGKRRGATRARLARPMFFIARAAEPIFPGCWVPTSTMRKPWLFRVGIPFGTMIDYRSLRGGGAHKSAAGCKRTLVPAKAAMGR